MSYALSRLYQQMLMVLHEARQPLSAREVAERIHAEQHEVTKTNISNIRRILEDLTLDGLVNRQSQTGKEKVVWESTAAA